MFSRFALRCALFSALAWQVSFCFGDISSEGDVDLDFGVRVASQADGSLTLTPPDTLVTSGDVIIADQPNVTGIVTIDGTSLESSGFELIVGRNGNGTLDIKNGGIVSSQGFNDIQLAVGQGPSAIGAIRVHGSGSWLSLPRGNAAIGALGIGHLVIEDGGSAALQTLNVGNVAFGEPVAGFGFTTVQGPSSELNIRRGLVVGAGGTGEIRIENGAKLLGGTEQFDEFAAYIGTQQFNNFDDPAGAGLVVVDGPGSLWRQQGELVVGGTGSGNLLITNGGRVTSTAAVIAGSLEFNNGNFGNGVVMINGLGSQWNVTNMQLGQTGTGQIFLSDGAKLINSNTGFFPGGLFNDNTVFGAEEGSFGRLVVDGTTTQWLDNSETLFIGGRGAGELIVQNGAVVANNNVEVGNGVVRVNGQGARWQVQQLTIGQQILSPLQASNAQVEIAAGASLQLMPSQNFSPSELEIGQTGELVLSEGRILGNGTNDATSADIMNRGIVRGSGEIHTVFRNAGGEVRIDNNERLVLTKSASNSVGGRINILGGELDARSSLLNREQSVIALENATLRVGQSELPNVAPRSENSGNLIISSGNNRIFGQIDNAVRGQIILSGNSQTTFYNNIQNQGTINVSTGSVATFFGEVSGNGVGGGGTVFLEGPISPGFSPGTMEFGGDVTLGDFSDLYIEVGNEAHDRLDIMGSATLDGDLMLSALSALEGDTSLEILSAESILGTFDSIPEVGEELGFGVLFGGITYHNDSVVVDLLQQTADFNLDGNIDGQDLSIWSAGFGAGSTLANGDADRDGDVDGADFFAWQRNFQPALESPSAVQAVPEPSSLALLASMGTALLGKRRRQHKSW